MTPATLRLLAQASTHSPPPRLAPTPWTKALIAGPESKPEVAF